MRAGAGCFVGGVIGGQAGERRYIYLRTTTWLADEMLGADQTPLPQATDLSRMLIMSLWSSRANRAPLVA